MELLQKRVCKNCGDLLRGRSDKVFCDDRCRNNHHNQLRKKPTLGDRAKHIQGVLIKNHRILNELLGGRKRLMIHRDLLLRRGFCFEIYSHQRVCRGVKWFYCLDIGYRKDGGGRVAIRHSDNVLGIFM